MSRTLLFALFCTSAIACTTAQSTSTTTAAVAPAIEPTVSAPVVHEHPLPTLDSASLRSELAASRAHNLARLEAYAQAGAFPKNQVQEGLLNVFRDDEGHLCAVANLIQIDGHTSLISATAANNNFIVLADVTDGPLLEWILASGFTQEEIAMIQVPYMGEFQGPEPVIDEQQLAVVRAREIDRVRSALLNVHRTLAANSDQSLDIAAQRASQGVVVAALDT